MSSPHPHQDVFSNKPKKVNGVQGYRPNTHDKTTVVKLEELVEEVRRIVRQTQCLYIQSGDSEWELIDDEAENEIIVERR